MSKCLFSYSIYQLKLIEYSSLDSSHETIYRYTLSGYWIYSYDCGWLHALHTFLKNFIGYLTNVIWNKNCWRIRIPLYFARFCTILLDIMLSCTNRCNHQCIVLLERIQIVWLFLVLSISGNSDEQICSQ